VPLIRLEAELSDVVLLIAMLTVLNTISMAGVECAF
jgi:hypothetical protein